MTNNFTYFRKYIIFKTDYLSIPGINPKGHGKIEVKGIRGNISINIENSEKEQDYTISFLKDKSGQIEEFNLGRIITNDKGKGRVNIPINLKDLQSQGFSIEDMNAILIRRDSNILLGDYIHKDTGILGKFVKSLLSREEIAHEYDTIKEIPQETPVGELEEIVDEEIDKETLVKEAIDDEQDQDIIDIREEGEVKTDTEVEGETEEDIDKPQTYSQEYIERLNNKNQMVNYILNVLRFFPNVEPFKINLQGYRWWRVDVEGMDSHHGFLPYFNYLMSIDHRHPFLNDPTTCFSQIEKYNHYLFGLYEEDGDTKYYIYGVPGKFTKEEHPFNGGTGFNIWFESLDDGGYWLLYINPMTGEVVYPLNPMVPAY